MTDKEPTLSPYDEGTDPETESFLLEAQSDPAGEALQADGTEESLPLSTAQDAPPSPPAESAAISGEAPTAVVPLETVDGAPLGSEGQTTDTIVRRTSLLHPDEPGIGSGATTPVLAAPPVSATDIDEYSSYEKVPSRAAAHWWSFLSILILTPIAWYLLADAGARLTLATNAPWQSGNINVAALIEFGAGLLVLVVIILALRGSSLGAWITGPLLVIGGSLFLAIPLHVQQFLAPYLETLTNYNAFGANLSHHLLASGSTGRFVIGGVALLAIGAVSLGARRQGRKQQRIADALERHS